MAVKKRKSATKARKKTATRKKSLARKKTTARKKPAASKKKATRKKTTSRKKTTLRKKTTARTKAATRKKRTGSKKAVTAKKASTQKTAGHMKSSQTAASRAKSVVAAPPAPTGNGAAGIRIRMYRVGFGDFFLATFPGPDETPLHVLIDCGVHAMNLGSIDDAIADMQKVTGGQLALVIMTHRHADHISGFASGADTFADFTVERVWMSWFENPGNAAAVSFQSTLAAVALNLQATLAARGSDESDEYAMAGNATGELGATGALTGNAAALDVLHGGFKNKPPIDYYQAGDPAVLPDSLAKAGLTATILGPPIDPDLVAEMDGKGHQYLASNSATGAPPRRFNPAFNATAAAYPAAAFEVLSQREIATTVAATQPDLMAAKAQQVDNTLNNQSLVTLFTFRGKTLLFAGDAQWGNWQNFLFGGALDTAGHDGLTDVAKSILGKIDFYKVGHHGSTNATPIDAANAMREDCIAMCSTQPGAYGSLKNNSEVPRGPLMTALDKLTEQQLARSDQVHVDGADSAAVKERIVGLPEPGPLPSIFQAGPGGKLYVDLEM
jgi:hypothetical protein